MNPDTPLTKTPALERLLGRLRRRMRLQVWLHGLGTTATAGVVWLLFAFVADYWLRVPGAVRALHGLVFLGVLGFFLWRDLLRPLRNLPDRAGLAVLLERPHPELRELLVSAAQLQGDAAQDSAGDPVSGELVQAVLAEAETRAASLDTAGVLDERPPRLRFGAGTFGVVLVGLLALARPELTRIFVGHLLGGNTPWPQRTYLALEIPLHDESAQIEQGPELVRVRIARGTDVPILVRAEGVVPSEVTLHFQNGRDRVLTPSGGGVFRTLLSSQQQDLAFHVTGGDDDDGLPRVEIQVLQPPDVEGVAVEIEPPSWTGLAPSLAFNRDVEVVAGSRLRVHVLPTPRGATGRVRLLPEDATVDLSPAPFPRDEDDNVAPETGLSFELVAATSVGYRFELVDDTGLANPDPGLFRIQVIEDRAPDVRMLAPARSEYDTVLGGAIPVRARADDDFGLTSMSWAIRPQKAQGSPDEPEPIVGGEFEALTVESQPEAAGSAGAAVAWVATRVDVDDLAPGGAELTLDQRFELICTAADNHQPEPGVGRAAPVRIRLISADELLRRMQDKLARARLDANRLAELQREKQRRTTELIDSLEEGAIEAGDALALHAAAVGQRRVQTDATSLARDLAGVTQDMLYARLDDKSGALLSFLDARARETTSPTFDPTVWQELTAAFERGELGAPGFTGNLVTLVQQALAVSEESAREAAEELDTAQQAGEGGAAQDALARAYERQAEAIQRIEVLLESLAEWDNFQNVLALTRDILNRSKALRDRTERAAKENQR
ncbi:MAG: hypothetical protein AAF682_19330 [Planctomycetota bacterium]